MSLAAPNSAAAVAAAAAAAAAALEQAPNALSQSMDSVNTVSAEEEVSPTLKRAYPLVRKSRQMTNTRTHTQQKEHAQNLAQDSIATIH